MKKVIAIIPARAGSKGLPDKNILPLNGKPLLAYAIEAAKGCKYITKIAVSTDSEKYKEVAVKYGAEVPELRPEAIAGDSSSMADAINHLLNFYKKEGEEFDLIVLLQPTSPLRTSLHIQEAFEKYKNNSQEGTETLVSVVKAPLKSRWLMYTRGDYIDFCFEVNKKNPQRQHLEDLFLPNGAIYIAPVQNFHGSFYSEKTLFYEMKDRDSVDIDTIDDWQLAERLILER